MTDPLGLVGQTGMSPMTPLHRGPANGPQTGAPDFRNLLEKEIAEVNRLQQEAKEATEDLVTGRRDDVEGVVLATQKADTAFRMLLQVRNKVMEAYEEVKQIRV